MSSSLALDPGLAVARTMTNHQHYPSGEVHQLDASLKALERAWERYRETHPDARGQLDLIQEAFAPTADEQECTR